MATNYIATAHESDLVRFATIGKYFGDTREFLLTAKSVHLDLQQILDGCDLSPPKRIRLPLKLAGLWTFRPKSYRDCLFILSSNFDAILIELNEHSGTVSVQCKFHGKYPCNTDLTFLDSGPLAIFDNEHGIICLFLYPQRIEIIRVSPDGKKLESFPIRVENTNMRGIISAALVSPGPADHFSFVTLQNSNSGRTLSFSSLNFAKKVKEQDANLTKLDLEADHMIAHTFAKQNPGVFVIGEGCVQYFTKTKRYSVTASPFLHSICVTSSCRLTDDGSFVSFLLSAADGRLVLLAARISEEPENTEKPICSIFVELMGIVTAGRMLAVLSSGVIFLGACSGPCSMIIRLRQSRNPQMMQYFDVLATFPAFGAILDLNIRKSHTSGQGGQQSHLLACTADTNGDSISMIRSGIDLQNQTLIELEGIERCWTLQLPATEAGVGKSVVVLSDATRTRFCSLEDGDLVELSFVSNLITDQRTLLCTSVQETGRILQVTPRQAVLTQIQTNESCRLFTAEEPDIIACAKYDSNLLAIGSGRTLHLFDVEKVGQLAAKSQLLEHQISAVELYSTSFRKSFCIVGYWVADYVEIISVPDFAPSLRIPLSSTTQPFDIRYFPVSHSISYVLCGFGEGSAEYFAIDQQQKSVLESKTLSFGTRAFRYVPFIQDDECNLFVASDRPAIITRKGEKLSIANVNVPNVLDVCRGSFDDNQSLLLVTNSGLLFGALEDIQKIHVLPFHLGFQAMRFALQPETGLIGVIGDRRESRLNKFILGKRKDAEAEVRELHILDQGSFVPMDHFRLSDSSEVMSCICSWQPPEVGTPFFIVGTEDAGAGRIHVLQMIDKHIQTIHEYKTTTPIRQVAAFHGWLLTANNTELVLYEWLNAGHQLEIRSRYETDFLIIYSLDVFNWTVTISDIHKSVTILEFNQETMQFTLVARDFGSYAFQSIAMRDEESVIGSDDRGNLLMLTRRADKSKQTELDIEQKLVRQLAWINVGDAVTCIRRDYLIAPESVPDLSFTPRNGFVFGTSGGQLGVIIELEQDVYGLLKQLEERLFRRLERMWVPLDPAESLYFRTNLQEAPHSGFVCGDTLQSFLDIPKPEQKDLMKGLGYFRGSPDRKTAEQKLVHVTRLIEDLARLH